jgi:hypothetical protein
MFGSAVDENSPSAAVNLVRRINTAEHRQHQSGAYMPIAQLSEDLQNDLRSYEVHLTISADRNSYALLVRDKQDNNVAFYTDERGLIYEAAPLR